MFEIALKHKRHGLDLGRFANALQLWDIALREYLLTELPVSHEIFYQSVLLPDHHADPFDRLLIAQSQIESLPLITKDEEIRWYEVETIW